MKKKTIFDEFCELKTMLEDILFDLEKLLYKDGLKSETSKLQDKSEEIIKILNDVQDFVSFTPKGE